MTKIILMRNKILQTFCFRLAIAETLFFQFQLHLLSSKPALKCSVKICPLDMKGCICNFTKWMIHPFILKGTMYCVSAGHVSIPYVISSFHVISSHICRLLLEMFTNHLSCMVCCTLSLGEVVLAVDEPIP